MISLLLPAVLVATDLKPMEFVVGQSKRSALVAIPDQSASAESPIIFSFHGHGGSARSAARKFNLEKFWPGAIVVYMQGLPAPGKQDPRGQANGWQKASGDLEDRDIKFFDEALSKLKSTLKIDPSRIYAMGHSNGGGFTYLLWSTYPKVFAAIGVGAGGFRARGALEPVPVIHLAGEKDTNVLYANQLRTVERLKQINGSTGEGTPWGGTLGTRWKSPKNADVVLYSYPGTHTFPSEGGEKIVEFFKSQKKPSLDQ